MTIAIDPKATWEWIDDPDRELPEDDPNRTVWELRVLAPQEEAMVQDHVAMAGVDDDEETRTSGFGTTAYRTVRLGLVGCRNFRDAEGKEFEIQRNKGSGGTTFVVDAFLAKIPSQTRARMCNEITSRGAVTNDDEKKP